MPPHCLKRIFLARVFTQNDYGVYSLCIVIFSILTIISLFGLGSGTTRYIAYYRRKNDQIKVKQIILSSIQITLLTSIIFSISLFLVSDLLSQIFRDSTIAFPLKIISISIPFSVMIDIFVAISRGFNIVKEKIYFQDISPLVKIIL